jgi:hypothetical protein
MVKWYFSLKFRNFIGSVVLHSKFGSGMISSYADARLWDFRGRDCSEYG